MFHRTLKSPCGIASPCLRNRLRFLEFAMAIAIAKFRAFRALSSILMFTYTHIYRYTYTHLSFCLPLPPFPLGSHAALICQPLAVEPMLWATLHTRDNSQLWRWLVTVKMAKPLESSYIIAAWSRAAGIAGKTMITLSKALKSTKILMEPKCSHRTLDFGNTICWIGASSPVVRETLQLHIADGILLRCVLTRSSLIARYFGRSIQLPCV